MNRDDIIQMARLAGFRRIFRTVEIGDDGVQTVTTAPIEELTRFAELVAAAEREECAKVCDSIERRKWETLVNGGELDAVGPRDCAAAIRARAEA